MVLRVDQCLLRRFQTADHVVHLIAADCKYFRHLRRGGARPELQLSHPRHRIDGAYDFKNSLCTSGSALTLNRGQTRLPLTI